MKTKLIVCSALVLLGTFKNTSPPDAFLIQNNNVDPDIYHKAKEWVKKNHPELIEEPCKGIWEGGPTPCECVKAMVKGFSKYVSDQSQIEKY